MYTLRIPVNNTSSPGMQVPTKSSIKSHSTVLGTLPLIPFKKFMSVNNLDYINIQTCISSLIS